MSDPVINPDRRALTSRFEDALDLASEYHRRDVRKGTSIPYLSHLLQVAGLVLEAGGDEDQAIVGLLHDAVEDAQTAEEAAVRRDAIGRRFGDRVLGIVDACTDGDPDEKQELTWRERKERYLAHLEDVAPNVLLVSVSDKLHNARAVLRDYRSLGEDLWGRFNGGKGGTLWYYRSLADLYRRRGGVPYAEELGAVVEELERHAVRGSRRHVLNWVESSDFVGSLNDLLEGTGAVVSAADSWLPHGWDVPAEAKLDGRAPGQWPPVDWEALQEWWLAVGKGNVPNWDLLSACEIDGTPGLVLVEAKAHSKELSLAGKRSSSDSEGSMANHDRIGSAIEEARTALEAEVPGIEISRDRAYQLSNRIAHAWWLARHGVPVVLLYLGFTGDERMADVGEPYADDASWQEHFRAQAAEVFPADHLERRIDCGPAAFRLLVRSMSVPEDRS